MGLPDGEEFELEIVTDKRWLGYAKYLGGLRTHISVNLNLPLPAPDLVHLTSHEIYGGHHTHRVWQEVELVRGRGQAERALDLLWSPEAVISEGIAETGPEIVAADGQELAAEVLGRLGFEYDAEVGARVTEARLQLWPVASNVAMLLHARGIMLTSRCGSQRVVIAQSTSEMAKISMSSSTTTTTRPPYAAAPL